MIQGDYRTACVNYQTALDELVAGASTVADSYYRTGSVTKLYCMVILFTLAGVGRLVDLPEGVVERLNDLVSGNADRSKIAEIFHIHLGVDKHPRAQCRG